MRLKPFLDGLVIVIFVAGLFGLGWSLAGRTLDLNEISKNFEAAVYQSQINAGLVGKLNAVQNKEGLRLVFVGDVMLSRGVANQIRKHEDFSYPFREIAYYLNSFDLAIGNLEGPISDKGQNQGSIYSFRADPKTVEGLKFAGFDLVSLANNHMFDWGREALVQTRELLEASRIKAAGAGENYTHANEPAIFEIKGQRLAFLSYTDLYPKSLVATETSAGVSDSSIENIIFNIERLKEKGYWVAVLMHWGEEYQAKSNSQQQKMARAMIESGADLIVGTHPHVPQEVEAYQGKSIVYSLGNFVFDQNFSEETMRGQVVEVEVRDGKVDGITPREIQINSTFQAMLIDTK